MLFLSAGSCGYNHNQALIPSSMVARLPPDSSLIFLDCRVDESVIKFSHIGVTSCCRCKECVEPSSSSLRCECRTVSVKRAPPSPHKTTLCVTDDRLLCPSLWHLDTTISDTPCTVPVEKFSRVSTSCHYSKWCRNNPQNASEEQKNSEHPFSCL